MTVPLAPADPRLRGTLVRLGGHWRALFLLAWPVMLSRAGILVMAMVNVIFVGRFDTVALAQFSLGLTVFLPVFVAGVGCLVGIVSVTARADGAGEGDLPAIALRGLWWAGLIGAIGTIPILLAGPILRGIGQDPVLADGGAAVALWLAPGALFQLLFVGAGFYLEGTRRMKPGLIAMIAANVVNLVLCWLLVGGRWGIPALGAEGAAISATLSRVVMAVGLLWWMLRLPEFSGWAGRGLRLWGPGGWRAGREMRRIGLAGGAAYFFETFAFAALAQTAGLIGATALAAYTILHNIESIVFMIALGISVATAVRVGQALGSGDRAEARLIGVAGLTAAMALIFVIGIVLLIFAPQVTGIYSTDAALRAMAVPLFVILCFSMVFDAGQVVLGQCTRALGDSWGTTLRYFIAFWLVMIPSAVVLAFYTPLSTAGLFIGTGIGCFVAVVLLGHRFLALLDRAEP